MTKGEFAGRAEKFALTAIKVANKLPETGGNKAVAESLVKSATRLALLGRNLNKTNHKSDFIQILDKIIEKSDECVFWIEIIKKSAIIEKEIIDPVWLLADEINKTAEFTRKSTKTISQDLIERVLSKE